MKTLYVRFFAIVSLFFLMISSAWAQSAPELSVGADVVSSYVWRGSKVAGFEGVNIQPSMSLGYDNLSFGAWGSSNFNGDTYEFDLSLSYGVGGMTLMVTDYWFGGNYFRYGKTTGNHFFEGTVAYDFGEKLPLSLSWNTLLYGNDLKADGGKRYTTYVEAAYSASVGETDITLAVGASPWTSNWYHFDNNGSVKNGFQVNNISLTAAKEIKITESFSLPLFGQIVVNPCQEDVSLVFGFSL